jgi:Rrf2 family protein
MFSKSCEYGIRAAIFIAVESFNGRKTGIKEIARQIDSPEPFTAKILQILVKHQIITSFKGPSGGFFIPVESLPLIKLATIVSAIDGDKVFKDCALGLKECTEESPCPLHCEFKRIREELEVLLKSTSIEDSIAGLQLKQTFLKK